MENALKASNENVCTWVRMVRVHRTSPIEMWLWWYHKKICEKNREGKCKSKFNVARLARSEIQMDFRTSQLQRLDFMTCRLGTQTNSNREEKQIMIILREEILYISVYVLLYVRALVKRNFRHLPNVNAKQRAAWDVNEPKHEKINVLLFVVSNLFQRYARKLLVIKLHTICISHAQHIFLALAFVLGSVFRASLLRYLKFFLFIYFYFFSAFSVVFLLLSCCHSS